MAKDTQNKRIEFRSEPVQEILGSVPSWIIRWGTLLFFAIVALLLAGSWFFKYPEVVPNLDIELVTTQPPADVVARSTGKIEHFFISDKQQLNRGDSIAVIENPARYEDIFSLKEALRRFRTLLDENEFDDITAFVFDDNYRLGEVQEEYAGFLKDFLDLENFIKLDYHNKKIATIEQQINDYNLYYNYLYTQKQTLEEDLQLENKNYSRFESLYDSNAISTAELENARSALLQKQHVFEGARTNLANTQIRINELGGEIIELRLQFEQRINEMKLAMRKSFNRLNAALMQWTQDYLIVAPINGQVTFNKFWTVNQNINAGEKIISIVPADSSGIIGKLTMPVYRSGKVRPGQKVNIRFDNYPYMEFGMVSGCVEKISVVPADNTYSVDVSFPNGLRTNYQIDLPFVQMMRGKAEIVTQDSRFLERIIRPIRSLIKNRSMRSMEERDAG